MRAFIAIEIPARLRDSIHAESQRMRQSLDEPAIRWVRPEGYHLTLKFLGDIEPAQIPLIEAALESASQGIGCFSLRLGDPGVFPNIRRPRVLWVGVGGDEDALGSLQSRLEQALAPIGFRPEGRAFHPHVTLARIKRPLDARGVAALQSALREVDLTGTKPFLVEDVRLIRSELRPTGAVYTTLRNITLEQ